MTNKTDAQRLKQAAILLDRAHMRRNSATRDLQHYRGYGNPLHTSSLYDKAAKRHDFYLDIILYLRSYIQNYETGG